MPTSFFSLHTTDTVYSNVVVSNRLKGCLLFIQDMDVDNDVVLGAEVAEESPEKISPESPSPERFSKELALAAGQLDSSASSYDKTKWAVAEVGTLFMISFR